MRILLALSISNIATVAFAATMVAIPGVDPSADPCWLVCDEYKSDLSGQADLCGPLESRCITATDVCTNLFLIDGGLLNSETCALEGVPLSAEERSHPLTCSRAREMAAHRYIRPRRAPPARRVLQLVAAPAPQFHAGVRGLRNIGSVCYFNTAFQILTHVTPVRNMLDNLAQMNQAGVLAVDDDTPVIERLHIQYLQSLANLYSGMNDYEAAAGPQSPADILQNLLSLGYHQYAHLGRTGDSPEALLSLLDATSASLASFQGPPAPGTLDPIRQIFSIDIRTQTTCASCGGVLAEPRTDNEVFTNIALQPYMQALTLAEGLHFAFGAGETDRVCFGCGIAGIASRQIVEARDIFVVQVLRVNQANGERINTPISFPAGTDETLDLTPFLAPGSPSLANPHYSLIAIAHHTGGHYFVEVVHEGAWFRIDDGVVIPMAAPPASPSATATLFVYQRLVAPAPAAVAAVGALAGGAAAGPAGQLDIAAVIAALQAQTRTL